MSITVTPELLDELERLATVARDTVSHSHSRWLSARSKLSSAAHPAVILALVARIRELEPEPCERCHGTGEFEGTIMRGGVEHDVPLVCDCGATPTGEAP